MLTNIFQFINNPTIIAAFLGALSAWLFSFFTNYHEFNKRKSGVYSILNSEIIFILNSLKIYQRECLKGDIPQDKIEDSKSTIRYFYLNCNAFPNFKKFIWKEIIDFLPDFFSPDELEKIISFYYMVNELQDDANFFSRFETYPNVYNNKGEHIFNFSPDYDTIWNQRKIFRDKLLNTIGKGDEVLKLFK